ncbi:MULTISPECIES: carboxymuconolactone decarboxylase family protein [Erwiniaceae]|uniref:Carboxymuconolactone decarboxylase family protein n=1 Tax=Enterobacter agglomerans TaxID=549 RepID=A0ACC5RR19_ENTAG|nr:MULTISPECIES: carboxymuconolactone decarboxylase family protein [Erwiniaceae]MBK4727158.1 carboxymuconolactone decarboxylase family protein [Pantoea agglomerans]MBP2153212.1 AhpD family alkylhydroperoxidase [Erwinia rhapontici]UDQ80126.1 carboxymuconolactone decarboxylase family protein [Erwinia rhapontici]
MSERINFYTTSPAGMKALAGVSGYVTQSGLPHDIIELAFLRVSEINGCAYCIDMHTKALHKAGLPWDKIVLTKVWREAGNWFSPREQAALAWAESLTLIAQTHAPDAVFAQVQAEFSDKEITDLTITIGLMNAYNRLAIALRKLPDSAPRS